MIIMETKVSYTTKLILLEIVDFLENREVVIGPKSKFENLKVGIVIHNYNNHSIRVKIDHLAPST